MVPWYRELDLSNSNIVNDHVLHFVGAHCKKLEKLNVCGCHHITPDVRCNHWNLRVSITNAVQGLLNFLKSAKGIKSLQIVKTKVHQNHQLKSFESENCAACPAGEKRGELARVLAQRPLEQLELWKDCTPSEVSAFLSAKKLHRFRVFDCQPSAAMEAALRSFFEQRGKHITHLEVMNCSAITDAILLHPSKGTLRLGKVKQFVLQDAAHITSQCIRALQAHSRTLEHLSLCWTENRETRPYNDADLAFALRGDSKGPPALRTLSLHRAGCVEGCVGEKTGLAIASFAQSLVHLDLSYCYHIPNSALLKIADCVESLRFLSLIHTRTESGTLRLFLGKSSASLQELEVDLCYRVNSAALLEASNCSNLRRLSCNQIDEVNGMSTLLLHIRVTQ